MSAREGLSRHQSMHRFTSPALRYAPLALSSLTMALHILVDFFGDTASWELQRLASGMEEWLYLLFPNSLYVFFPSYFYTIAGFVLLIAPLSYVTGHALDILHKRAGLFVSSIAYAALSFGAIWLTLLHVFQVPWSEAFSWITA